MTPEVTHGAAYHRPSDGHFSCKSNQGEVVNEKGQTEGGPCDVIEEGEAHRGAGVGADPAGEDDDDDLVHDIFLSFRGHFWTSVSWQLSTGRWTREGKVKASCLERKKTMMTMRRRTLRTRRPSKTTSKEKQSLSLPLLVIAQFTGMNVIY